MRVCGGRTVKDLISSFLGYEGFGGIFVILHWDNSTLFRGESLVIGGIRKTENRSVVRGVPFLKDIPLIGILFSSKDFEERAKEILFIITPSISSGGIDRLQLVEKIHQKHEIPESGKTLQKSTRAPFGYEQKKSEPATEKEPPVAPDTP